MKTKQIWILLVILVILGIGTFLRQTQKPSELALEEFTPLNLSFDEAAVQKIVIERTWEKQEDVNPVQRVEIVKSGEGWKLPEFYDARVSAEKIKEFFRQTREAQGEQRARGKELLKDFGIEDRGSFRVLFYGADSKPLLDFFLGLKTARASFFIRKAGSDSVYLTGTNFFAQMGIYGDPAKDNLFPEKWAAADFLKFDSAKVQSLEIKNLENRDEIKLGLERVHGQWQFKKPGGIKVSAQKVSEFIAGMASWSAEKVIAGDSKDFSKPFWQMTVGLEGAQPKVFKAVKSGEKNDEIFIRIEGEKTAYQFPSYYFESLNSDDAAFAEEKASEAEPSSTLAPAASAKA